MRFSCLANLCLLSLLAGPVVAQALPFPSDNEDVAIYGTDIAEFTWLRGQYTNHGGGQGGYGWRRRGGWCGGGHIARSMAPAGCLRPTQAVSPPACK